MRINTSGKKEYRDELYQRTADVLDESTKTGAIDEACIHVEQDIDAKEDAIKYLAGQLPPHELQRVAEILSTTVVEIDTDLSTEISLE